MAFLHLFLLLCCSIYASSSEVSLNATVEIDLVFPQNDTYTLVTPFPIIFIIQQAQLAYGFGFTFEWNITGRGSSQNMYYDQGDVYSFWEHQTPPDSNIIVNSTLSQDPIAADRFTLPAGQWTLAWSYSSGECIPEGIDSIEITHGTWGASIDFTTVDSGGTAPDLTICPIVALEVPYVANSTGTNCPSIGIPTTSYASVCDAKLSDAEASSVSAEVSAGTYTSAGSPTGSPSDTTATPSASSSGTNPTHRNAAEKEQFGSILLSAVAGIAGLGVALL